MPPPVFGSFRTTQPWFGELEVLRLVDRGLSNGEIATKLFVAPSTVKTHLENVYDKLGVRRRTQAVSIAREQGLLS